MKLQFLLALALPAFAEPRCPYAPEREIEGQWQTVALAESDEACSAFKDLVTDFERIRAAAGLNAYDVSLRNRFDNTNFWASFRPEDRQIEVSWPTLLIFGRDPAMRQAHLSHEIGHVYQKRAGQAIEYGLFGSERSRYIEAEADLLGRRFLDRAGYPADTAARGWESTARLLGYSVRGPEAKLDDPDPWKAHPTYKTRYFNLIIIGGHSEEPLSRSDFNDFGRLKPGRWLVPEAAAMADRLIDDPEFIERVVGAR